MRVSMAVALVGLLGGSASIAAQAPAPRPATARGARPYAPPRLPWGDPDISGNVTNVFEASTPFERPDDFAGRRLEEVQGDELTKFRSDLQKRTLSNFEGPLHGPDHWWQSIYDLRKGGQAWFVIDPPDGRIPPTTAEAQQRPRSQGAGGSYAPGEFWESAADFNLYDRCITRGLPGSMMPAIYGNSYQLIQAPGYVAIRYEMIHETRIIPLDGRPHLTPKIRSAMGDARGHWEGQTLVVETTNFNPRSTYRNADSTTFKLIERFTPVGPNRIEWAVTSDDPKTWTRPWTFAMNLTKDDSQAPFEYACHEGNYGLPNILSAARAEEKQAN